MDPGLSHFIQLNTFPTGRRLHTFRQVLPLATKAGLSELEALLTTAIEADEATWALELKWASQRKRGKLSAKQIKARKALQLLDNQVDRSLIGLRDGAEALIRGAGPEEQDLIDKVESFLDELFPHGAQAVTILPFSVQLTAVKGIVAKLQGNLAPVVAELGLGVQAARVAKLCTAYEAAQQGTDTLEFGDVRAARNEGQNRLLEVIAVILGTFHKPEGDHAKKRAALLAPIMRQNEAISEYVRSRRAVSDVHPESGEEQPAEPEATAGGGDESEPPGGEPPP